MTDRNTVPLALPPRRARTTVAGLSAIAIGLAVLAPLTTPAQSAQAADAVDAAPPSWTFTYTGGPQTFTVPENTTRLTIEAWGGRGGDPNRGGQGAAGAEVTAGIDVTGISTLTIWVGHNAGRAGGWGYSCGGEGALGTNSPHGAYDGGGGGGSSAVTVGTTTTGHDSCDLSTRPAGDPVVLAGGGGGGGGQEAIPLTDYDGGNGGMGGKPPVNGQGGAGGGDSPGGKGGGAGSPEGSAGLGPASQQDAGGGGGGGGGWTAGGSGGGGQGGQRVQGNGAVYAGAGGGGGTSFASGVAIDPSFADGSRGASSKVVITGYIVRTFSACTKKAEHWAPPAGVEDVFVAVEGASGGHRRGSNAEHAGDGGHGGLVTATLSGVDWSKVDLSVGCAGSDGRDGGGGWGYGHGGNKGHADGDFADDGAGGGGGSAIAFGSTPLVVAGGGGGGGGGASTGPFGWLHGGDGGDGVSASNRSKGPGHDGQGVSRGSGGCPGWDHNSGTNGGAGGHSSAANDGGGGGGGGGGWHGACGGEGGGSTTAGGGGGGGGSFASLSGSVRSAAYHVSKRGGVNGQITLSYAPPGPQHLSVTAGSGQSAETGGASFTHAMDVQVTDATGEPWPDTPVTFTVPSSGASGTIGNQTSYTVTTDGNGIAELDSFDVLTNDVAGNWSITATTPGVRQAAYIDLTNTTIPTNLYLYSVDGSPSAVGQPVTIGVGVTSSQTGDTPVGTVQFAIDGADYGAPVQLVQGDVRLPPFDTLTAGSHTITALYSGSDLYAPSSAKITQVVVPTTTATTVTSSANPSTTGQSVTFDATVVAKHGRWFSPGTPTGTVQFSVDGTAFGAPVELDASAKATSAPVDALTTGTHTVTAAYSGPAAFAASSGLVVQNVDPSSTLVDVTSSLNPSTFGQTVAITASLGDPSASGTVQFTMDGVTLGDPVPVTDGTAQSPVLSADAGSHVILAAYSGDATHGAGSGGMIQTVDRAASTTALSGSPDPAMAGDAVTFTASVSGASAADATLDGNVQFTVDGSPLGAPVVLVNGEAVSSSISTLTVGGHEIGANYSDDANHLESSASLLQRITASGTHTTIAASTDPSVSGQATAFSAQVVSDSAGAGLPTGDVRFVADGKPLGSIVALDGGRAVSDATSELLPGTHQVTVQYLGDASHTASFAVTTQTVGKADTSVSLTAEPGTGDALDVVVAVHVTPPGGERPGGSLGGTVEVSIDGASVGDPVLAVDDDVTLRVPLPASGTHRVKAVYSGDSRFNASSASTTVTVHGGQGGGSSSRTGLAATGQQVSTLPLGVGGALLLAVGALVLVATRRRRESP